MHAYDDRDFFQGEAMNAVWVVDDDRSIRWVLEKALAREGIAHKSFASVYEVTQALQHGEPQVIVTDIRMPGESGLVLLGKLKESHPTVRVIIMTAYSDLDSAVAAFQGGAFEYLPKPFDIDHALALIRRASAEVPAPTDQRQGVIDVEWFWKIFERSSLHRHSVRAAQPFVAINTAAIPKDLLESELFGHERGAFTGAQSSRRGRFEQADGGTLFLDEIGDMPPDLQVRLLRVLADGEYYRVGGHAPLRSNVRIIAATHQNLEERVQQGLFREDLLHRLNVVRLRLPPLRERGEDIAPLTRHFLLKSARDLAVEPKQLSDAALKVLSGFAFPGNVRQLENICHWLTVMGPGQRIEAADLPPELRAGGASGARDEESDWQQALDRELARALARGERAVGDRLEKEFERTLILRALAHTTPVSIEPRGIPLFSPVSRGGA